jgi:ESCRT-II complex subunit VPS25
MVKRGTAEWDSKEKIEALIYWRTPEDWATQIWNWVSFLF